MQIGLLAIAGAAALVAIAGIAGPIGLINSNELGQLNWGIWSFSRVSACPLLLGDRWRSLAGGCHPSVTQLGPILNWCHLLVTSVPTTSSMRPHAMIFATRTYIKTYHMLYLIHSTN